MNPFLLGMAAAIAVASTASAQSASFNVNSSIFVDGDLLAAVANSSNTAGLLEADVDGGTFGFAQTDVLSNASTLTISSSVGMLLGAEGNSLGSGQFAIDGTQPILVNWNWTSVSGSGRWSILNSLGNEVASLSFVNGVYQSTGGSFSEAASGSGLVNLAAGTYTLRSLFINSGTAQSQVTFSFGAIPAPGALALLGAAGLAGTRRRR